MPPWARARYRSRGCFTSSRMTSGKSRPSSFTAFLRGAKSGCAIATSWRSRISPGREVRLRYGYFMACTGVVKDEKTGEVLEIHCTYDPATRGGNAPDGRKVKSTIHWVSAAHAIDAEVRLYD